jgi:fumarate reductase subunit C
MKKRSYFLFIMRELSCIAVAWSAVFLMMLVYAIGRGAASYQRFLDWAASPVVVVVNVMALAFLVLHTVTWFALTPQAMVVRGPGSRPAVVVRMVPVAGRIRPSATVIRVGGRVPAALVIASQYLGLAVVSAFIAWLVLR